MCIGASSGYSKYAKPTAHAVDIWSNAKIITVDDTHFEIVCEILKLSDRHVCPAEKCRLNLTFNLFSSRLTLSNLALIEEINRSPSYHARQIEVLF